MAPSFRYHLLTIVSIFMALGLGMLIGSLFLHEAIVDRLSTQVKQLNLRFTEEVAPLRDENKVLKEGLSQVEPHVIRGTLRGVRVSIVQTGDYPDAARRARLALSDAGATILSTTVLSPSFALRLDVVLPQIRAKLQATHPTLADSKEAVFRVLAAALARGGAGDIEALVQAKLVSAEGGYDRPSDVVVIVGGSDDPVTSRSDVVDVPLLQELASFDTRVIGVEPSAAVVSYVPVYAGREVATVDNVDTALGAIALALVAKGETGDYGTKSTARSGMVPAHKDAP